MEFTIPFVNVDVDTEEPKESVVGVIGGFLGLLALALMWFKAEDTAEAVDEQTGGDEESQIPEV